MKKDYVGFIVDGLVPCVRTCIKRKTLRPLVAGWSSGTSGSLMRFGWVSKYVNRQTAAPCHYELYRPWRAYRLVVCQKSMNQATQDLTSRLKAQGVLTVFDANVDYFTPALGTFYYDYMAPTDEQRRQACAMARTCDAVIGDSQHLVQKALVFNKRTIWISDNVRDNDIREESGWMPHDRQKLPLVWCGEAVKLFELLHIEKVLRSWRDKVRLRIVTNSLDALHRLYEPWQGRLRRLLDDMDCEIIPFQSIEHLFTVYDLGGVFISPRFLDNTYNLGHTEWKITLAMGRGRVVLCSPQPSYEEVAQRAAGRGIRVCRSDDEWMAAFTEILEPSFDWSGEQKASCQIVREHYATSVVAKNHVGFMNSLLCEI